MKSTLEKLWNEYFSDECAVISTDEERTLTKKTIELYEKANALLNDEQEKAVEQYLDSMCDLNAFLSKKAFLKGCELATSFLLESMNF